MATILLSAAGAALGAGFGGTLLGLSGAVIGRAVGATIGRAIDQRILGGGSEPVEVGRLDRLHVMGASEGTAIARTWGRMRLPGQVIWASPYREIRSTSGGGKGAPKPKVTQFSYSVSLAIALCEGEIQGVGRIWADGKELAPGTLEMRVYCGSETQMPDPVIAAGREEGSVPAYRGTAYVVFENLSLEPFGNRVPQFSFEVIRRAGGAEAAQERGYQDVIRGVAIIPGTGEYALATSKVRGARALAITEMENVHTISGVADFSESIGQLTRELPACKAASLIVSWFGNDLRCGMCAVKPKIAIEAERLARSSQKWRAGGVDADAAELLPEIDGRRIYGGTPSDASVLEAIRALADAGQEVMFYPFLMMDQTPGNGLPDPYGGTTAQAALPWRGRITLASAPGRAGSTDGTAAAREEVAAFFGSAQGTDFRIEGERVFYDGPDDWGYRRFILHYAHLCKIAGGVESFCIGSELRGLTTIMAEAQSFPAVEALIELAQDVRAILGPRVKISYAADWSEYFGYHRGNDVHFHLDPLWAHPDIDFIGIDNYMPLSDWRDGDDHADAGWGCIYDLDYLSANVLGGEGYEWYYDGPEGRNHQLRRPIADLAYGEDWIYRYKDLKGWWSNAHHSRIGGVRSAEPTSWVPGSKPIRFTEYGCPAVDKGTNEPNRFVDPKSSESGLPRFSNGQRDDYLQMQYFRAMDRVWNDPVSNPPSGSYGGRMVDTDHCYAWAWDARPFPEFPRNSELWSDGANWKLGHWLNGRATLQPLAAVVREICETAGVAGVDCSRLHGAVHGFAVQDVSSARAALQPLAMIHAFDAIDAEGRLSFLSRLAAEVVVVKPEGVALDGDMRDSIQRSRLAEAEIISRARLGFVADAGDFGVKVVEAAQAGGDHGPVAASEYTGVLPDVQARAVTRRWLTEGAVARDQLSLRLPPSRLDVAAGTLLRIDGADFRVDRVEVAEDRLVEAVRVERSIYDLKEMAGEDGPWSGHAAAGMVAAIWMDLPLPRPAGEMHKPTLAVAARPWPGPVAVWKGVGEADYEFLTAREQSAAVGITQTPLARSRTGLFDETSVLRVQMTTGALSSATRDAVLSGRNIAAIGDGGKDNWEIFQFREAVLRASDTYELSGLLRGQFGTDGVLPEVWPAGSIVVLLDGRVGTVELAEGLRHVEQDYRVGDASKGPGDEDATFHRLAFAGHGLRPYSVCHIRAALEPSEACRITWIRRTRIGGDGWEAPDVPLSEESERYLVRLSDMDGNHIRDVSVSTPAFTYTPAERASDGLTGPFRCAIAQMSANYGAGPWREIEISV